MVEAYLLVKTSIQQEYSGVNGSIVEKLKSIKGVESAELLFGDYDVIIKLNVSSIQNYENVIIDEIANIESIESIDKLLCVDHEILE